MGVRLRLRDEGFRNHRFWWIVVQPKNKNLKGKYLEKVGYWLPRKTKTVQRAVILNRQRLQYWLGCGAMPTKGVHRLLEKFEMVPKYPPPFGSKSLYYKPEKEYGMEYFKNMQGPTKNNKDMYIKGRIQEQMNILERKRRLQVEAMENLGGEIGAAIPNLEEAKTTDIESEEADIFERKTKFDELSKRLEKHRKETAHLKGNDLRFNIYMRKLNKLTRNDLGLDLEAYKDYINNLKHFAHVNQDFELYARDQLKVDDVAHRTLIEFGEPTEEGALQEAQFKIHCREAMNTLRKLKREAASYLYENDYRILDRFLKDMRMYMEKDFDIFTLVQSLYIRRKEQNKEREGDNYTLDLARVKDRDVEDANLSRREWDNIKMLLALDPFIFKPNEFGVFSPQSLIVDISKYGDKIPQAAKEILYRPPKFKTLYEKYWQLAKIVQGRVKEENDRKSLREYTPRFPAKTAEELQAIDKVLAKLDLLIAEDEREMLRMIQKEQELKQEAVGASTAATAVTDIESLRDKIRGDFYYEGAGVEALKEWKNMSEAERALQKKGDEIDDISTSDLEKEGRTTTTSASEDEDALVKHSTREQGKESEEDSEIESDEIKREFRAAVLETAQEEGISDGEQLLAAVGQEGEEGEEDTDEEDLEAAIGDEGDDNIGDEDKLDEFEAAEDGGRDSDLSIDEDEDLMTGSETSGSSQTEEDSDLEQTTDEEAILKHFEDNRINLARAFLGYKGGYSVRKLKKFYKQSQDGHLNEEGDIVYEEGYESAEDLEDLEGEDQEAATADQEGEPGEVKVKKAAPKKVEEAKEGVNAESAKRTTPDGRLEPYSDESDIEEWDKLPEEEWKVMLEDAMDKEFEDPDEVSNYIKEKYLKNKKRLKKRDPRKPDVRAETDPYYRMFKDDAESITPINEVGQGDEQTMVLSNEDFYKMNDIQNSSIGRYPIGYRQYENYENYLIHHPHAHINEYMDVMNKQIEFEEFKEMLKNAYLQQQNHPYFKWLRSAETQYPDVEDFNADEFVTTGLFDDLAKEQYQLRVKSALLDREWYKFVDALEEFCDFWNYGTSPYTTPLYNSYIPSRTTIMARPKLNDERDDDTSYRYGLNRISHAHYLNPLKGYKMSPAAPIEPHVFDLKKKKKWAKYRRLSHSKMNNFSTNNRTSAEEEERRRQMWYMSQFSNSYFGVTQNPLLLTQLNNTK